MALGADQTKRLARTAVGTLWSGFQTELSPLTPASSAGKDAGIILMLVALGRLAETTVAATCSASLMPILPC